MRLGKAIASGLVVLCFGAVAPLCLAMNEHAGTDTPSGYSDSNIEYAVNAALNRNPALGEIEASVSHGIVTLSGTVSHYQDKIDAEAAVRQVAFVRRVRDEISLATPAVGDAELEDRLRDRLRFARADIGLSFPDIQVEAHRGLVILTGTVHDSIEHAAALALVGSTDGVVSIQDKLSIEPNFLSDEATRIRVNKALYRAARADGDIGIDGAMPVRAIFADGAVTLMGSVEDAKTKETLLSTIKDVPGVLAVNDEVLTKDSMPAMEKTAAPSPAPCADKKKEVASVNY